jgi:hypothetical protein
MYKAHIGLFSIALLHSLLIFKKVANIYSCYVLISIRISKLISDFFFFRRLLSRPHLHQPLSFFVFFLCINEKIKNASQSLDLHWCLRTYKWVYVFICVVRVLSYLILIETQTNSKPRFYNYILYSSLFFFLFSIFSFLNQIQYLKKFDDESLEKLCRFKWRSFL